MLYTSDMRQNMLCVELYARCYYARLWSKKNLSLISSVIQKSSTKYSMWKNCLQRVLTKLHWFKHKEIYINYWDEPTRFLLWNMLCIIGIIQLQGHAKVSVTGWYFNLVFITLVILVPLLLCSSFRSWCLGFAIFVPQ